MYTDSYSLQMPVGTSSNLKSPSTARPPRSRQTLRSLNSSRSSSSKSSSRISSLCPLVLRLLGPEGKLPLRISRKLCPRRLPRVVKVLSIWGFCSCAHVTAVLFTFVVYIIYPVLIVHEPSLTMFSLSSYMIVPESRLLDVLELLRAFNYLEI